MDEHFDVVVVGSGFGGSVVSYRMAEAGKTVCLLERGKSYPPGSFPRRPRDLARNLWDPQAGLYGMFDVWSFRRLEALVSSGLGGGSLIYANVLIRKDPKWFVDQEQGEQGQESWPITYEDLESHYEAAEQMLGATPYPFTEEPYRDTGKTRALRDAAATLGLDWALPNLAVTFARGPNSRPWPGEPLEEPPDRNLHHRHRSTCRLCGECDVGCNYGAKNSLDFNYLSRAKEHHADIRTMAEVRRIEPRDGPERGFRITYVSHDPDREAVSRQALPHTTVTADNLVLAAGSLGTTHLLLKNRSAFPHLGPALGTRFSGNGDVLTFLRHRRDHVDGSPVPRWLDPAFGPVITSRIRVGDALDGTGETGRGFYAEDGGYPHFLSWLTEAADAPNAAFRLARFVLGRLGARLKGDPRSNLSSDVSALLGRGEASGRTMPILVMGRDVPDGVMRLRKGNLDVDWTMRSSSAYFSRVQRTLRRIAQALDADIMNTPLWLFRRLITVHPVGGCPMGADPRQGVVDSHGQAFHYPGLYVADGSAMPGPVGPNPSLTIAAFAERVADGMLRRSA
jgi:cholesterol oxidase